MRCTLVLFHFSYSHWLNRLNKILTQQLPAEMQADQAFMASLQSSDKQKIAALMQQYLFSHTEIFKKFTQDKDFQRRYKEFVFDALWAAGSGGMPMPGL